MRVKIMLSSNSNSSGECNFSEVDNEFQQQKPHQTYICSNKND